MKNYCIRVKSGYGEATFFGVKDRFDIVESVDEVAMIPVNIELTTYNDTDDDRDLIATVYGYYFDLEYMYQENIHPFQVFDAYSQDTYELYGALFDDGQYKDKFEPFEPNVFYIDNVYVEEKYREKGYFTMLINQLDEILRYLGKLNVGVIATLVYIPQTDDKIDSIENLTYEEQEALKEKLKEVFIKNKYEYQEENNFLVKIL